MLARRGDPTVRAGRVAPARSDYDRRRVSPLLYRRLKAAGIVHPIWTARYAAQNGVPLELACAILTLETAGGINEFGHDPTIFVGAGAVTKAKYLAYRALRDRMHENQGVGPMQLTSGGLQDQADKLGGCWDPRVNIAVGLHFLGELLTAWHRDPAAAAGAYNGSGTNGHYARMAVALAAHFRKVIAG